jgi:hypothetical protein
LTKFSLMILAAAILALYGVRQTIVPGLRGAIPFCGAYAVSLLALWWLTGQDLGDLGPSLWISLAITAGYGPAMSLRGAGVEPFLYLVGTTALLGGLCIARRRTLSRQGGVELAGVALLGFGLFKHGFLRHDAEHTFIAASGLLAIALVYSSTGLWGIADVPLGVRAGYALAMVAGCTGWPSLSMPYLPTLREQVSALLHPLALMERYTSQFSTYWVSRQKQPRQACRRAQAGSFEQVNGHFR